MNTLLQDLRYGARMLLKNPGVTAIAVITLALGIGANTAIFSVVDTVALRPLPYKNPDRLVSLWENVPARGRWRVTPANFFDWKKQNTVFENLAAFGSGTLTLTGDMSREINTRERLILCGRRSRTELAAVSSGGIRAG